MSNIIKSRLKSENYKSYKKEIACVGLSALFIFLTISLISYSSNDNSFFHFSNERTDIANWCGVLGANFAALFFYLFSHAAYLFLISLAGIIFLLFKAKNAKDVRSKIIAIITFFFATTTLMSVVDYELNAIFSGGMVGNILAALTEFTLGTRGSILILIAIAWISVNWFLEISMIPIIKDLLSGLKDLIVAGFKMAFAKIFKRNKTKTTIKTGASVCKETDAEMEYWKALLEKGVELKAQETAKMQEPDFIDKLMENFANKKIIRQSQKIKLGSMEFVRLANTALTKNIFSAQNDEPCIYEKILETVSQTTKKQRKEFVLPDPKLFSSTPQDAQTDAQKELIKNSGKKLEEKLLCFGVKGSVSAIKPGPVITLFEYKPEIDSKISKITAVEDDLTMALTAKSLRIMAPIPGKNVVGFEISNQSRQDVVFGDVSKTTEFEKNSGKLPLILGVDVTGKPIIEDLSKMPHLLIGGATGSGKSVGLNAMIISLLCKLNPDQLKMVLIDPKRLEFGPYADTPHLLFPVVTNATTAIGVLKWVVQEMENRYQTMATAGVRNINEYNALQNVENMPFIVVVIDELADLMMVAGKDVETQIVRIAQMSRAAGIHMMVATQRPSVEVVTGLIKVNFTSRIAFRVSSKIDSRTVLDSQGAEKLLGRGDMLFMNSSSPDLTRIHGVYVSDDEIRKVVEWWKAQQEPTYLNLNEALKVVESNNKPADVEDEIYGQVLEFIKTTDEVSISLLQRYFRIGFNRSARLIEKLEMDGIIAPAQGSKTRKVIR